jgi:hypothetical protein
MAGKLFALLVSSIVLAGTSAASATVPEMPDRVRPSVFPGIADWSSVRVSLRRSLCFGTCPAYSVEVRGSGEVLYQGIDCVAVRGEKSDTIPLARVRGLIAAFQRAGFFALKDSYRSRITDIPTFTLTVSVAGQTKVVEDYGGTAVGMPDDVRALEDEVDRAAATDRWTYDGTRTCHGQAVNDDWRKNR